MVCASTLSFCFTKRFALCKSYPLLSSQCIESFTFEWHWLAFKFLYSLKSVPLQNRHTRSWPFIFPYIMFALGHMVFSFQAALSIGQGGFAYFIQFTGELRLPLFSFNSSSACLCHVIDLTTCAWRVVHNFWVPERGRTSTDKTLKQKQHLIANCINVNTVR